MWEFPEGPADARICPVCWKPISRSDAVVASGDWILHVACQAKKGTDHGLTTALVERVTAIWRRRFGSTWSRSWSAGIRGVSAIRVGLLRKGERSGLLRRCRMCGALPSSANLPSVSRPDLLVVSRERGDLYDLISRFGRRDLEVRLDQRGGERRRAPAQPPRPERRRAPNRRANDVTVELAVLGWAMIPGSKRRPRAAS